MSDLRKIAEAATEGPWRVEVEHVSKWESTHGAYDVLLGVGPFTSDTANENWSDADVRFIATFDPPTVLALLDVAELAEAQHHHLVTEWERLLAAGAGEEPWDEWERHRLWLLDQMTSTLARLREATT